MNNQNKNRVISKYVDKKQILKRKLMELENDAKTIRRISFIVNTVMGNACYSDKEREKMIHKGETLGNLNQEEKDLLNIAWDKRNELAKKLMNDLKEILT